MIRCALPASHCTLTPTCSPSIASSTSEPLPSSSCRGGSCTPPSADRRPLATLRTSSGFVSGCMGPGECLGLSSGLAFGLEPKPLPLPLPLPLPPLLLPRLLSMALPNLPLLLMHVPTVMARMAVSLQLSKQAKTLMTVIARTGHIRSLYSANSAVTEGLVALPGSRRPQLNYQSGWLLTRTMADYWRRYDYLRKLSSDDESRRGEEIHPNR
mmetsp:Transcript_8489/g.20453  ORF Transcript_8489/g.20453 Transcript_8489/m.20453 type:complete len:212 (-) Transcript_8489:793-1428(-)